jgi:hypothetical protein
MALIALSPRTGQNLGKKLGRMGKKLGKLGGKLGRMGKKLGKLGKKLGKMRKFYSDHHSTGQPSSGAEFLLTP